MKTPEKYVKDDVAAYLKGIGAYVVKPATFGYGGSGAPDRVCCFAGRFIGIEVKREGKTPTALQHRRLKEIHATGGVAIWGDSSEKIIEQLKAALGLP